MSYLDMARRVLNEQTRENANTAKKAEKVRSLSCVECGHPIDPDEPETWWGLDRVHYACGKAAWATAWKREALPAETEAAH
jgi:hypothetical protein